MDVIQLLPLNDSGIDPSPYSALSSCALNPLYLSLHRLPLVEEIPELKRRLKEGISLTDSQRLCFPEIQSFKWLWLQQYVAHTASHLRKSRAFHKYVEENAWLEPYALFKVLKEKLHQIPCHSWPRELHVVHPSLFSQLTKELKQEIFVQIALQYLCFVQMSEVKAHARSKGVLLKGDIPILISRDSADVWHEPELFDTSLSAGAPPDTYNAEGQYWGFPIYRWDAIKKTHFRWWKERLRYASHFYDLYRIDHVLGFFRIWAIPLNRPAKEGAFMPAEEALWQSQGQSVLQTFLNTSELLPIAEDLGTVPPMVRPTLARLGICGTRVMRWERSWETDGSFIPVQSYSPLSLTCVSTHDTETLELWWRVHKEEAQAFATYKQWTYEPQITHTQRVEILRDSHQSGSLWHINLLQEYLALFPALVWPHPEDERINIPGTIGPTNWTYRFRPSIEEIIAHEALAQELQRLLF